MAKNHIRRTASLVTIIYWKTRCAHVEELNLSPMRMKKNQIQMAERH